MSMSLTLPVDLDTGKIPSSEVNNGEYISDGGDLNLASGTYVSDLSYTAFNQSGLLSKIESYGDGHAPKALTTAQFSNLHLVAGETLTITYNYIDASAAGSDSYSFAFLGTSLADAQTKYLQNSTQVKAYGYNNTTSYAMSFNVTKTGTYSLLLGNASNSDEASGDNATLRVASITNTYSDSGTDAYTVTPTGVQLADGTVLTSTTSGLSGGAQAILSEMTGNGLISQDGNGLISQDGNGLIGQDGNGFLSKDGGGLINQDGNGLISQDGNGIINQDGNGLIAVSSSQYTTLSLPLTNVAAPTPPAQTLSAPLVIGTKFQIGESGTTGSSQNNPCVAALSSGKFVVVWSNDLTTPGHFEVRAQLRNADGSADGASFIVSTDTTHGDQYDPSVTGISGGGFAVTWRGQASNTSGGKTAPDIHLQLFNATGQKVLSEATVGLTSLNEYSPRVASLSDGGFVLTSEGQTSGASSSTGAAVRYDSNRKVIGVYTIGDASSGTSTVSAMAATGLKTGGFAVAYREVKTSGADKDGIYLDVIGADGTTTLSQVLVNTSTAGTQNLPSIATLSNGDVAIAWVDDGTTFGTGLARLRAQIIDPTNGQLVGQEITIANTLVDLDAPSVVALANGTFSVTWDAPKVQGGTVTGLRLNSEVFNASGTAESPIIALNPTDAYREGAPAVTQLSNGAIYVVGQQTNGPTTTIEGNRISVTGPVRSPPSGTNSTADAVSGYSSTGQPDYEIDLIQQNFGFTDVDGTSFTGVTIDTLPVGAKLTLTNFSNNTSTAVTAGQFITAAQINGFQLHYASTDAANHSFTFQVHDNGGDSNGGSDTDPTPNTLTIHADAQPQITNTAATARAVLGGAVTVSPGIKVSDADDTMLSGAYVLMGYQNLLPGDVLAANTTGTNITATYYASSGNLNLSGADTIAHYQQVLRSVTYSYTGSPSAVGAFGPRTVLWEVVDPHNSFSNQLGVATDITSPINVTTSSEGPLKAGQVLKITVNVDAVVPLSVTGKPSLKLDDGGVAIFDSALSNPATGKLVFDYTVGAHDSSTDISITGVTIPSGASIKIAGVTLPTSAISGVSLGVVIDTSAPATPAAPYVPGTANGFTNDKTLTFEGFAEPGSTVTLYDGTKAIKTATAGGAYSITATFLAGSHAFSVTATDVAGNISSHSSTLDVVIDTTAPAAPLAPTLLATSDTGTAGDNITKDTTVTLTGIAEAGSKVTLYDSSGANPNAAIGTAMAAAGTGAYSITVSKLAAEAHGFHVTATDAAGNVSASSPTRRITIETTPPAVPAIPILGKAFDTGTSSIDGITNIATPTMTGTAAVGSTVTLFDGTTSLGHVVVSSTGAYAIVAPHLMDGKHLLHVTATDVAGNVSGNSPIRTIVVDTKAPVVAITRKGGTTNVSSQTISGTGDAGTIVTITDTTTVNKVTKTTVLGTAAVGSTGKWSKDVALPVAGVNRIVASDTDLAGNKGSSAAIAFQYTPVSHAGIASLHSLIQAMAIMSPSASASLLPTEAAGPSHESPLAAPH